MEYTRHATERKEKLAKKLPKEAMEWIEQRTEELAKADLLSSVVRIKHIDEAYEQWKQKQQINAEEALTHEQDDGVWLGKKMYYAMMRPNGHLVLTDQRNKAQFTFTAEESYDLLHFLSRHRELLHKKGR